MTSVAPRDFTVLLPAGWERLSFDDALGERVGRFVNARVEALPAVRREAVRQQLTSAVLSAAVQARDAGGVDLLLCATTLGGQPISAACLVSHLDTADTAADDLAATLLDAGADCAVVELPAGASVRRLRTTAYPADADVVRTLSALVGVDPAAAGPVAVTEVTYFLRLPGAAGMLVLSFSAAIPELAEAFVALFDAIAGTVRWI